MVSTSRVARTRAGVLVAVLSGWVIGGGASLGDVACGQEPGDNAGRPAVLDFDRFFDQMFGQQTPEQKRALEQVEISWQDEEQFGRQALERFLAELRQQNIRVVSRGKDIELPPQTCGGRAAADAACRPVPLDHSPAGRDPRNRTHGVFLAGTLLLFRGMLEEAQNEAALVGVIGHELSHIDHGHQLRYLKSMKLAERTFTGGMPADPRSMMNNTMLLTSVFARPFRPEDEAEADRDGATWAYRAGYDPRELAKLFLRFEERRGKPNAMIPSFFRTHPVRPPAIRSGAETLRGTPADRTGKYDE